MTRIGILGAGFVDWAGGVDFLHSIVDSIRATNEPVEMHFLLGESRPRSKVARWRQALHTAWAPKSRISSGIALPPHCDDVVRLCAAAHRIGRGRAGLNAAIEMFELDALLPSHAVLASRLHCPWIGYGWDFQHRQLPQLFTARERRRRHRLLGSMMANADAVVVNSHDTAAEGRLTYPRQAEKILALPFNAAPRERWLDDTTAGTYEGIPFAPELPYFMVSNQFWMHKDHPTAFKAFARTVARHPDVRLVCTGETSDYRRPSYFAELRHLLDDLGIADRVAVTGILPKSEQIALLRNCVALLQPTRCEGGPGGGAVYDAVSLGVRSLVSDIPINRELAAERTVTFFPVGDAEALAARMSEALATPSTPPEAAELLALGRARRAACGRAILDLVAEVCARRAQTSGRHVIPTPIPSQQTSAALAVAPACRPCLRIHDASQPPETIPRQRHGA